MHLGLLISAPLLGSQDRLHLCSLLLVHNLATFGLEGMVHITLSGFQQASTNNSNKLAADWCKMCATSV
jgi:hypothetical protein